MQNLSATLLADRQTPYCPQSPRGQQTDPSRGSNCLFPSSTRNIKPGDKLISSFCFWRHIAYRLSFGLQITCRCSRLLLYRRIDWQNVSF